MYISSSVSDTAAKERKKPSKIEETKSTALELSPESPAAENGLEVRDGLEQLNGKPDDGSNNEPVSGPAESAFSNDSKMCNTNPHLNALNTDSEGHRDDSLGPAVLKTEE